MNNYKNEGMKSYNMGQIPRNGLTWGFVCNSGGSHYYIILNLKIFIINELYAAAWYLDIMQQLCKPKDFNS